MHRSFAETAITPGSGKTVLGQDILEQLTLSRGDIDIWVAIVAQVPDADLTAQLDAVLTEDERKKHAKLFIEKVRRRYLVTRSLVRYVLSRYVPIRPADWRFEATAFGRPTIANTHSGVSGLSFNLSHSDRLVTLAVTRDCEIGIDVEDLGRRAPLDIAERYFSPDEARQLRSLPEAAQPQRFFDFWTLKESYIKARGKGLSLPLDQFGFDLRGDGPLRVQFDPSLDDSPCHWTFWQWRPSADSLAALCVENRPGVTARV
ncbi:4'-phosphopantetheinyl transferase family protein, partial [Trinickia sp.]|uniref:4'-phosphopantetheinyl transferase family protein n=1 Tax=Trinickia sp. TaxID=2571163 RepID=UPI003F80ADE3